MCIIAIKEAGVAMPDLKTLQTMWDNNPDGAGYMFPMDGKVHIRKGFMEFNDLKNDLDDLAKVINIKETPVIMHFRIGTHGVRRNPANTHPFPVSANRNNLKSLEFDADIAFAHNGIIDSVDTDPEISDTMMYAVKVLTPMMASNREFYKNNHLLDVIDATIGTSRMVFMDGAGYISKVGYWTKDDETGVIYSNTTYKPSAWTYGKNYSCKTNMDAWKSYLGLSKCGTCDYDDEAPLEIDNGDWDVMSEGCCYKKLTGLDYWVTLADGTSVSVDEYEELVGAPLYVDELGTVYAHIAGEGMIECDDIIDAFDENGILVCASSGKLHYAVRK